MDTIHVNKQDLISKLRANREKHKKDFEESRKTWRKKCTKALKKAAKKAEEKGEIEQYPLADLPKPTSYLESYDDAIARVEADIRKELELDDREFAAWMQDKWNWRGQFVAQTSLYNG